MLKKADVQNRPVEEVVDLGVERRRIVGTANDELDVIKDVLRGHAESQVDEDKQTVDLHGTNGGYATITFPKTSYKVSLKDGLTPEALKAALGTDLFNLFFEEVVSVKVSSDYENLLVSENMTDSQRDRIMSAVQAVVPTPRVGFSK